MNFCVNCGKELQYQAERCTYCGHEISDSKSRNEDSKGQSSIGSSKIKNIALVSLVLLVLIGSLLFFFLKDDSGEETAIGIAKGYVVNMFTGVYFVTQQELDMKFSNVEVELVDEETENKEGRYEVTGSFEFVDPTTEEKQSGTFTGEVTSYNGAYLSWGGDVELND